MEEGWERRCPSSYACWALPHRRGGGRHEAHGGGSRCYRRAIEEADAELMVVEVDAIATPWRRLMQSSLGKARCRHPHASATASPEAIVEVLDPLEGCLYHVPPCRGHPLAT
jgi:hypothetical protein